MSSAAAAVEDHLLEVLLPSLFPEASILRGHPGAGQLRQDVVALVDCSVQTSPECMGPRRPLAEQIEITLLLSCTRVGRAAVQRAADHAAWAMYGSVRDALRDATTPHLGGTCREARVTSARLERSADPEMLERGRSAAITVTLSVRATT